MAYTPEERKEKIAYIISLLERLGFAYKEDTPHNLEACQEIHPTCVRE